MHCCASGCLPQLSDFFRFLIILFRTISDQLAQVIVFQDCFILSGYRPPVTPMVLMMPTRLGVRRPRPPTAGRRRRRRRRRRRDSSARYYSTLHPGSLFGVGNRTFKMSVALCSLLVRCSFYVIRFMLAVLTKMCRGLFGRTPSRRKAVAVSGRTLTSTIFRKFSLI